MGKERKNAVYKEMVLINFLALLLPQLITITGLAIFIPSCMEGIAIDNGKVVSEAYVVFMEIMLLLGGAITIGGLIYTVIVAIGCMNASGNEVSVKTNETGRTVHEIKYNSSDKTFTSTSKPETKIEFTGIIPVIFIVLGILAVGFIIFTIKSLVDTKYLDKKVKNNNANRSIEDSKYHDNNDTNNTKTAV